MFGVHGLGAAGIGPSLEDSADARRTDSLPPQQLWSVRSVLCHDEVRCTDDRPEVEEHRRLVDEARRSDESAWEPTGWTPEDDEEIEW
ncbi:hypothetical protein [Gemmatimonas sp.]|uniref:hypothetical protein n=1 Tax=Gemmatimonas sp. TaxID=1962908 RepID=UPI00356AC4A1